MSKRNLSWKMILTAFILILAAPPLMWCLGTQANQKLYSFDKTLSSPQAQIQPSSDHLALLVAAAHQHRTQDPAHREISLHRNDIADFLAHLSNAGARRGWLVQSERFDTLLLTMPAKDLRELDEMAQDPLAWLSQPHRQAPGGPTPPDIINIRLKADGSDTRNYHILEVTSVLLFVGIPFCLGTVDIQPQGGMPTRPSSRSEQLRRRMDRQ